MKRRNIKKLYDVLDIATRIVIIALLISLTSVSIFKQSEPEIVYLEIPGCECSEEVVEASMIFDDGCSGSLDPIYDFTDEEVLLMAQLLSGDKTVDGDGEYDIDYQKDINHEEVNKVLCVVMNRVFDDRFPDTVEEVILARNQFSVMPKNLNANPTLRSQRVVKEWCDTYANSPERVQTIPGDHVYFTGNGITNTTRR